MNADHASAAPRRLRDHAGAQRGAPSARRPSGTSWNRTTPGELEVVIALGPSTDRTDEIAAELVAEDPAGAHRAQPHRPHPRRAERRDQGAPGTRSWSGSTGTACSRPTTSRPRCGCWTETGAANVGGIMHAEGENDWEHAVAAAMTSKIGVGNAAFHTGGAAGPGRHRLPRRLPARGAGAAGRLQRGVHPRPGLGAELPHPRGRRPHLVLARAAGLLPAPARACAPWPSSTRTTAAGAGSSPATTAARSTCATSPPPAARAGAIAAGIVVGAAAHPVGVAGARPATLAAIAARLAARRARACAAGARLRIPLALATMHMSLGLRLPDQPALAGPEGHRQPPPRGRPTGGGLALRHASTDR